MELFSDPEDAVAELRFVADAMRLQAANVFKAGPVEAFSSLAVGRVHKDISYARGFARAILSEDKKGHFAIISSETLRIPEGLEAAARIALAAVARRESFTAAELALETGAPEADVAALLKKFSYRGALQVLPRQRPDAAKQ